MSSVQTSQWRMSVALKLCPLHLQIVKQQGLCAKDWLAFRSKIFHTWQCMDWQLTLVAKVHFYTYIWVCMGCWLIQYWTPALATAHFRTVLVLHWGCSIVAWTWEEATVSQATVEDVLKGEYLEEEESMPGIALWASVVALFSGTTLLKFLVEESMLWIAL